MAYILKIGNLFVIGYDLTEEKGKSSELTRITLSTKYAMRLPYETARIISEAINAEVLAVEDSPKLKELNQFLTQREKKLQRIEQIYKNNPVDLEKISKIILEEK